MTSFLILSIKLKFQHKNLKSLDELRNTFDKINIIDSYSLEELNIKKKLLPPVWNLVGMVKKDMFHHNWTLKDKTPYFMKYGLLWHFTGFPIEERIRIMNEIWDNLKHKWTE